MYAIRSYYAHILNSSLDAGGAVSVSAISDKDIDAIGTSIAVSVDLDWKT